MGTYLELIKERLIKRKTHIKKLERRNNNHNNNMWTMMMKDNKIKNKNKKRLEKIKQSIYINKRKITERISINCRD